MSTTCDPTLLATSDVLVLNALSRAYSRGVPRSQRAGVRPAERHRAYETNPIGEEKIDAVMTEAWLLCPQLHSRHRLDVNAEDWVAMLDNYTRALLMMGIPHSCTRLADVLRNLAPLTTYADDDAVFEDMLR